MTSKTSKLLSADKATTPMRATPRPVKLTVDRLTKRFALRRGEPLIAVDTVSFDVHEYETVALLGPSGCGKSTILRIIAGLETPSDGEVRLDGHPVAGPGRDRGMVMQSYTSFPWLSVQQNVEYGLRVNGVPRAIRSNRAEYFLDLVKLGRFKSAYPDTLSGGMRQRVAIARTLANQPSVLLMDEPFGALDAETRWQMQELLAEIVRMHKMTLVLVTHDLEEAIFLADRIVFLSAGPGRVHEILPTEFKREHEVRTKEDMLAAPGYIELESHLMGLMRTMARDEDA
ncbi:MAG: ABC transporter ATP-binding protein [Phycisphaeraceae bacterium]